MVPRTINNIEVGDYLPLPQFDPFSGPVIVTGSAPGVEIEYDAARRLFGDIPVLCVNHSIDRFSGDYWVTVHHEIFDNDHNAIRISDKAADNIDIPMPIATRGGSSSLLAVLSALVMGATFVVTAGIHLCDEYKGYRDRWVYYHDQIGDRIFSMSPKGTYLTDTWGHHG